MLHPTSRGLEAGEQPRPAPPALTAMAWSPAEVVALPIPMPRQWEAHSQPLSTAMACTSALVLVVA